MIEHQNINGRDVWLKIDPHPVQRENPNIFPREYFTATYYLQEPHPAPIHGETVLDDDGEPKLFESPVAALSYAWKKLKTTVTANGEAQPDGS
jgi:hypothetical protein